VTEHSGVLYCRGRLLDYETPSTAQSGYPFVRKQHDYCQWLRPHWGNLGRNDEFCMRSRVCTLHWRDI